MKCVCFLSLVFAFVQLLACVQAGAVTPLATLALTNGHLSRGLSATSTLVITYTPGQSATPVVDTGFTIAFPSNWVVNTTTASWSCTPTTGATFTSVSSQTATFTAVGTWTSGTPLSAITCSLGATSTSVAASYTATNWVVTSVGGSATAATVTYNGPAQYVADTTFTSNKTAVTFQWTYSGGAPATTLTTGWTLKLVVPSGFGVTSSSTLTTTSQSCTVAAGTAVTTGVTFTGGTNTIYATFPSTIIPAAGNLLSCGFLFTSSSFSVSGTYIMQVSTCTAVACGTVLDVDDSATLVATGAGSALAASVLALLAALGVLLL